MSGHGDVEARAAARHWVVRLADGDATAEDRMLFDRWLIESEDHALCYSEALRLYSAVGDLSDRFPERAIPPSRRHLARTIAWGGGLIALAAALVLAFLGPFSNHPEGPRYASATGQLRSLKLPDGSVVTLGARTELQMAFTRGERRVRLGDGEAYFRIAHNADRPFFVEAGGTIVRVIGTEFEVKASGARVKVSVRRGIVEVTKPGPILAAMGGISFRLTGGEELAIPDTTPVIAAVHKAEGPPAAWLEGFLAYDDARLSDVVADANRYSSVPIRITDPALAGLRVTAAYPTDQLDRMLASLDAGLPVDIDRTDGEIRIVAARPE
jgi:transmembrane sensor